MVANAARPIDPPTWRAVFRTPEASPAWRGGTPEVAAAASGVKESPTPKVVSTAPPRTPFAYVLEGSSWAIHKKPAAEQIIPVTSTDRAPTRPMRRALSWLAMMIANVVGRKKTPVRKGPKPSTSCM